MLAQRVQLYRRRKEAATDIYRQPDTTLVETRAVIDDPESDRSAPDPDTIKITKENSIVFYQGMRIGVPRTLAGRLFYRTITADELCLWDQHTGELVLVIPLPVVAMAQSRKFINSYKIKGVYLAEPSTTWMKRHAQFWETLDNID